MSRNEWFRRVSLAGLATVILVPAAYVAFICLFQAVFHWGFNDPEFVPGLIGYALISAAGCVLIVGLAAPVVALGSWVGTDSLQTLAIWVLGPLLLLCWRWWRIGEVSLDFVADYRTLTSGALLSDARLVWPVLVAAPVFLAISRRERTSHVVATGSPHLGRTLLLCLGLGILMFFVLPVMSS